METAARRPGRRLFLLRQFLILQRHPRREQLRPPFPSCSFIFAFGVPNTSPVHVQAIVLNRSKRLRKAGNKMSARESDPHFLNSAAALGSRNLNPCQFEALTFLLNRHNLPPL
jgi:hypothetical protein